jgi:hypothetical protein
VAKAQGLTVQESGFFQREDPVPGSARRRRSPGGLPPEGRRSERTGELPRGRVFMALSQKKDPYVPKLEEVAAKVREDADSESRRRNEPSAAPERLPPR